MLDFDVRDQDSVVRDLASSDEEVRRLAVERIESLGAEDRIPVLVACLGDSDWRVRKAAVARLVAQPDSAAASDLLLAALADGDNPGRRNSAVEALVALGGPMVPTLLDACRDDDADVRKFAVDALAGIGDERSIPSLLRCLDESDPNVQAAAADALGAIGGEEAVRALVQAATDAEQDALVRFSAFHALDALEVQVRAAELAGVLEHPVLGPPALLLLGRSEDDPGAAEALLKGLTYAGRAAPEAAVRGVLRWIARADESELEPFLARLREVTTGNPKLVTTFVARLADAELGLQLALIQFLGLVGDSRAVLPILESCRDEALTEVALATLSSMDCTAILDSAFSELGVAERQHACAALGGSGGAAAVARLVTALGDPDPDVCTAAASALGRLGDQAGLAPLVRRLGRLGSENSQESGAERDAVVEALCELVASDAEGRACDWLGRAIELLATLWSDGGDGVRLAAATVLGRIARREDVGLITLLLKDPAAPVRCAAVVAISRIEATEAAETLHLAVADESPEVRAAAAQALGDSGAPSVLEDLRSLCRDEDTRVRAAAVAAIGCSFASSPSPELRASALAILNQACDDCVPVALSVVQVAAEIGGEAASYVAPLLARSEPDLVREAVRCFGHNAEAQELTQLLHLISHPDWSVRSETIEILSERRVRRAVPAILRRLETEQDDFVRRAMLAALARLED